MERPIYYHFLKARLIRRLVLMINLCVLVLTFIVALYRPQVFYFFLIGICVSVVCHFLLMRAENNYHTVINLYYFSIFVIVSIAIFTIPESLSLVRTIWLALFTLFAFLTLGNRWGWLYLGLTIAVFIVYLNFFFIDIEDFKAILVNNSIPIDTFYFIISIAFFIVIMWQVEEINNKGISIYNKMIQQLKEDNKIIETQNQEKNILLNEVHFRVKNNLNHVINLLHTQIENIESEVTKMSFKDAIQRIEIMSLIHHKIFDISVKKEVKLGQYIDELIHNIILSSTTKKIKASIFIGVENINSTQIVPLGLIINELVTNTLKHAFQEQEEGVIELKLMPNKDESISLFYRDNGKWQQEKTESESLGTSLIKIFTSQLDGDFRREIKDEGTFYYFNLLKN